MSYISVLTNLALILFVYRDVIFHDYVSETAQVFRLARRRERGPRVCDAPRVGKGKGTTGGADCGGRVRAPLEH